MCKLLADSPDAVAAATMEGTSATGAEGNVAGVFAVEVKTMTALRTIQAAKRKSKQHGKYIVLNDVSLDHENTQLFHSLVPTTSNRAQILHHAACLSINNVLYVVATGGAMTEGAIIYACMVQFAESIRHQYTYLLDCVWHTSFWWVGSESMYIPKDYDDMLRQSHASDIQSFMSYYGLSQSLRACVEERGSPLPPYRMIRLTPTVYWNHLKGGVDVISCYMKTLARCNISEIPVVSIIARILSMQVSNAAVVYRLYCARKTKVLPTVEEYENSSKKGYHFLRHNVSQCKTFGRFTRALAREWVENEAVQVQGPAKISSKRTEHISPMFSRNAAERYNVGIHKARRLNRALPHKQVTSKATYCVLCSWDLRDMKNGKLKVKRKGSVKFSGVEYVYKRFVAAAGRHGTIRSTLSELGPLQLRNAPLMRALEMFDKGRNSR